MFLHSMLSEYFSSNFYYSWIFTYLFYSLNLSCPILFNFLFKIYLTFSHGVLTVFNLFPMHVYYVVDRLPTFLKRLWLLALIISGSPPLNEFTMICFLGGGHSKSINASYSEDSVTETALSYKRYSDGKFVVRNNKSKQ